VKTREESAYEALARICAGKKALLVLQVRATDQLFAPGSFYLTFKGFDFPFGLLQRGISLKMFSLQPFPPFAGYMRLLCDLRTEGSKAI